MSNVLDLGDNHTLRFASWKPDRLIPANAKAFADIPDVERLGATIIHTNPRTGDECRGFIHFDCAEAAGFPGPFWKVESWEPLTLSPSLLCRVCGDHGFIRNGQWVRA